MAEDIKVTSFVGRLSKTKIRGNLLSDADIAKLKLYLAKIDANEAAIEEINTLIETINKYQRVLATQDFFTDETHKEEMSKDTIYLVAFKDGKFVAPSPDQESGKFWPEGKAPDYFELVFRESKSDKILKLGREKYTSNFDDFMSKIYDNEYHGYLMRIVEDDAVNDGDYVGGLTKFMAIDAATPPAKTLFTGHMSLDKNGKKLAAVSLNVKKGTGERQACLGVYKNDGSPAGEVCLKTTADGSTVTFTVPDTNPDANDNTAATSKFVRDLMSSFNNLDLKYQASAPDAGSLAENTLVFYDATDLL